MKDSVDDGLISRTASTLAFAIRRCLGDDEVREGDGLPKPLREKYID